MGKIEGKHELYMELDDTPRIYDITDFIKSHPGGKIITFYSGQDATDAFREFHYRSEKAQQYLKSLPNREATPEEIKKYRGSEKTQSMLKDFRQLRQELIKEGMFDNNTFHIVQRIAELLIFTVLGFVMCAKGYFYSGCIVLGIFMGRFGWLEHECGHYSFVGNIQVDKALQAFLYGVGNGCSASTWRSMHNRHHATPQRVGHDVDLNTLPFVAFNDEVARKGNPSFLQYQHVLYFMFLEVVALFWTLLLHPKNALRTGHYMELPFMAINHVLRAYAGYLYDGTITSMIISYFLIQSVLVVYIFGNFTLSHTHMPYLKKDQTTDWVRYASDYTLNVDPSFAVNWWMSFLNFQIEHHLFPSMPQYKIPQIKDRVKNLFLKHGIGYHSCGYFEAWRRTVVNMKDVGARRLASAHSSKKTKKEE